MNFVTLLNGMTNYNIVVACRSVLADIWILPEIASMERNISF
jgi:hypothetical protein